MKPFLRWLVFSALWTLVFLISAGFRMPWLCAGAGALFGFLTDCVVDVLAVKSHQRELRKRFEAHESESEEPTP
jgi:hypothetical protein